VIERLIPPWTRVLRDGIVPFLAVGKFRVDIEDYPAKRVLLVPDDLAQCVFRFVVQHDLALSPLQSYALAPQLVNRRRCESAETECDSGLYSPADRGPVFILASIGFAWITLKYAYDTARWPVFPF